PGCDVPHARRSGWASAAVALPGAGAPPSPRQAPCAATGSRSKGEHPARDRPDGCSRTPGPVRTVVDGTDEARHHETSGASFGLDLVVKAEDAPLSVVSGGT